MKALIFGAALLAATTPALAQTNVSITVGQPGFYGRIDIGDFAPPAVVYERPVIIREAPAYRAQPVYLRVPPGHRKKWSKFCGRYDACARPVYFVTDEWYERTYVPRYQERHVVYRELARHEREDDRHGDHPGRGKGHGKGHDKHDKHDKHGKGNGRGHD